ncbi:MAG: hypothetical protein COA43_09105 [Robiginitomaculum sp.]|nr:MAG: hypothetical protein COA43_09105 [Robiginitomaculum sp.]
MKHKYIAIKLALLSCAMVMVFMHAPAAAQSYQILNCSSKDFQKSYCSVRKEINSVRLHKYISKADCNYGQSWGYEAQKIWVTDGCRAKFHVKFGSFNQELIDEEEDAILGLTLLLSALGNDPTIITPHDKAMRKAAVRTCVNYAQSLAKTDGAESIRIVEPKYAHFARYDERSHLQAKIKARHVSSERTIHFRCDVENRNIIYFHSWAEEERGVD